MVVSLKANRKRIIAFLILVVVVVGACIFLWRGKEEAPQEFPGGTAEERVAFLESFGWQVDVEPAETREVMIPAQFNDVYTTYNVMQKAQGFDLKPYAGETCTQYKYKINNYPNETEVYATLLVRGNLIIGGDVACAEANGFMHGFAADSARYGETAGSGASSSSSAVSAITENSSPMESSVESAAGSAASSVSSAAESAAQTEVASEAQTESAAQAEVVSEAQTESTAAEAIPEEAFPTD